jgi:hypothetical protein
MGDSEMFESAFRKSRYSVAQGACVEVGSQLPGLVVIRDSQNADGARVPVGSRSETSVKHLRRIRAVATTHVTVRILRSPPVGPRARRRTAFGRIGTFRENRF